MVLLMGSYRLIARAGYNCLEALGKLFFLGLSKLNNITSKQILNKIREKEYKNMISWISTIINKNTKSEKKKDIYLFGKEP